MDWQLVSEGRKHPVSEEADDVRVHDQKQKNIVQYMMLIGLDKSGQKSDIYHTARQERRKPKGEI